MRCKAFQRKLQKLKKLPEMLGFDGEFPAVQPTAKFRRFFVKNCKKSSLKHSTVNQEIVRKFLKYFDLMANF